ncbi:MAG: hypothetical protein NTY02_07155 [Acidobacteria bacterium]|nr:hypothetical protein [Acidobacteriota bacterium]
MRRVLFAIIVGGLVMTATAEGQPAPQGRPPALTVQANILFLYYRDVPAAQRFYEDIIGLSRSPWIRASPRSTRCRQPRSFLDHPQNAALRRALGK